MNPIVIYTKDNCPQCKMTKRFLSDKNVAYEEKNIDNEPQYVEWLKEQGFRSVPVVTTQDKSMTIIGFRPDKLKTLAV